MDKTNASNASNSENFIFNQQLDKRVCQHPDESQHIFMALFLVFLACIIFSSTTSGFLFFITTRYRHKLWQPPYFLLKNMSICGIGMNLLVAPVVLVSVLQKQNQSYGKWCIAQFCMLRCLFLASQTTLALMSVERYIFICHGIHYLRLMNSRNVRLSIGVVWLVSGIVSFHGGFLLSHKESGYKGHTSGLVCEACTIKKLIIISQKDDLHLFGPPSVIMIISVLSILFCYGRMYHAALRVTKALQCSNHRANTTVGFYFLMFLLQLALNVVFIILTVKEKGFETSCTTSITPIVVPILAVIPYCINTAFLIIWNPQIKQLIFSTSTKHCQSQCTKIPVEDAFEKAGGGVEHHQHPDIQDENSGRLSLPGCVSPSDDIRTKF